MSWLPHFIDEPIYPEHQKTGTAASSEVDHHQRVKLGVSTAPLSVDDQILLDKILMALKVNKNEYDVTDHIHGHADQWLVFNSPVTIGDHILQPFEVLERDGKKYIGSASLQELARSVSKKKQLWALLQVHF